MSLLTCTCFFQLWRIFWLVIIYIQLEVITLQQKVLLNSFSFATNFDNLKPTSSAVVCAFLPSRCISTSIREVQHYSQSHMPLEATKKGAGSTQNGRDSHSKRLGIKKFGGQWVQTGNILVRQRGTKFKCGKGVKRCSDDTLMAAVCGFVNFKGRTVAVVPELISKPLPTLSLLSKIFTDTTI